MSFKKIVVPVTGMRADALALAAAFAAGRPFSGHVQALFVSPDPSQAVPFVGMPVSPEVVQQIIGSAAEIAQIAHQAARANIEAAAAAADVTLVGSAVTGPGGVTCSLYSVEGGFIGCIAEAAKLADLVVFAPPAATDAPDINGALIQTLTHIRRPVLLAPESPVTDLLPRIVVGWDGGIAAAHALSAALPLLKRAGEVEICSVGHLPHDAAAPAEAIEYLALHGVEAATRAIGTDEAHPGTLLLHEAAASGATLLVLGGYGHNRLSETLFGGTTMHIAAHATLPVFMTH